MVPASQGLSSTNWNSGELESKRHTRSSETAKVMIVVHSAIQRALRATEPSSLRIRAMSNAPSNGRNVVTERIGQLAISVPPAREHQQGDEGGDADQHGEGVVIHVAGLQPDHVAGDIE